MLPNLALKRMNSSVNKPFFIKDLSILGHSLQCVFFCLPSFASRILLLYLAAKQNRRTVIVEDWSDLTVFQPHNAIIVDAFQVTPPMTPGKDNTLLSVVLPILQVWYLVRS